MQWSGGGKRPWMQNDPITSYDRDQGGSTSKKVIYPLDGYTSNTPPAGTLYCKQQPDGGYYCAVSDGDASNGVNGSLYPQLPSDAVVLTREAP
tara:strand:+ start:198 stop:476 length:279 start_codon:yes stop_codon:yes gene_type:complete